MIKYETAVKLKEAGFPLSTCFDSSGCCQESFFEDGKAWHYPTLSELIEACLSPLQLNSFPIGNVNDETSGKIMYIACYPSLKDQPKAEGNSFEEAVANLWLATNNKD